MAKNQRWHLWQKQRGQCHYCKRCMTMQVDNTVLMCTVDHVVPRAHGGWRDPDNIVGACYQCNNARGTLPADLFARYVRRFGPPSASKLARSMHVLRRSLPRSAENMRNNGMAEPLINDVLRQKLEAAIRRKIALLDAAETRAA